MSYTDWEDMNDFEKWFTGSNAYTDDALKKDEDGDYFYPSTQEFHKCWVAAQAAKCDEN